MDQDERFAVSVREARDPVGRLLVLPGGGYTVDHPGIWLTPLLTVPEVRDAFLETPPPALVVGGTADNLWDGEVAYRLGADLLEFDGADHALHVGADWRRSIQVLHRTLERIEAFLAARAAART